MPGQPNQPIPTRCFKGVRVIRGKLPPTLLAERPGSFTCPYGNAGVQKDTEKESAQKVIPGEESSSPFLVRIRSRNLSITSPVLYQLNYPDPLKDNRL